MPSLSIFGVTGSVGASALKVIGTDPKHFEIDTITAHRNLDKLVDIAKLYDAKHVVVADEGAYRALKEALPNVSVAAGEAAIAAAAAREVDICLNSVVGSAGLPISLASAGRAKRLALANKESLVCAGKLLREKCAEGGTEIIPVDSEHAAIFQCLLGEEQKSISRLILTASGGPFRTWSFDEMKNVKLTDALKHPNWDMGARITIDSSNMFNKALEMIEAHELFDIAPTQIDVIVHPQSIVHSIVEFTDHSMKAHLGVTDMCHPIGYALYYPDRKSVGLERLDLAALSRLDFEAPDIERFKALRLAREVMENGGAYGAALNAAKEIVLDEFMAERIGFLDMADVVEQVLAYGDWKIRVDSLSVALEVDLQAREMARNFLNKAMK